MEQVRPDWRSFEFSGSLHKLGNNSLEHNPPVNLPFSQQSTKDGVADSYHHPGWLFRIEDGDEEFQHPLGPGILTIGYGKSVLRICCFPEFPADKFIRLGGKSLPSHGESIRFSPFLYIPRFRAPSDSSFVLVWGSHDKLPHHLLILDRPGFAHQPYATDFGEVFFQISSLSRLLRNGWYYGLQCEWRSIGCCRHHCLFSPSCFRINPLEFPLLIQTTQGGFSLFSL